MRVDVAEVFEDAELVPRGGEGGDGDVVEGSDAGGGDCCITD